MNAIAKERPIASLLNHQYRIMSLSIPESKIGRSDEAVLQTERSSKSPKPDEARPNQDIRNNSTKISRLLAGPRFSHCIKYFTSPGTPFYGIRVS